MINEMSQISHELHYIIKDYENMDCTAVHQETPPSFWGIFSNTFFNHFFRCRTQAFRAAAPTWPAWAMTRRCYTCGGGSARPERGDLKCLIGMEPGGWDGFGGNLKDGFFGRWTNRGGRENLRRWGVSLWKKRSRGRRCGLSGGIFNEFLFNWAFKSGNSERMDGWCVWEIEAGNQTTDTNFFLDRPQK